MPLQIYILTYNDINNHRSMRYRDVGLGDDLGLLFIHLTLHNLIIGSCLLQISVVPIMNLRKLSLQHEQKFVIKVFV